ncbi:Rieske (2Fe-2S) protein [Streptomyces toxytricini]|uniref:Cytochrome bc1 complex Rieske iron-sulfur subunit n=1 Tax=Streptomyces toxytricini TaxID=67369 RepID=A0ABW8ENI4_STRT5
MSDPVPTTRRTVLAAGAAALAGGALAGCGGEEEPSPIPESAAPGTSGPQAAAPSESAGTALLKTSEVPVGGGTVLKDRKLVVTQPAAGTFKCFSAVCTHQGCLVNKVAAGTIDCPCHGSRFAIADGAVTKGPATRPLPEAKITVSGDQVSLA